MPKCADSALFQELCFFFATASRWAVIRRSFLFFRASWVGAAGNVAASFGSIVSTGCRACATMATNCYCNDVLLAVISLNCAFHAVQYPQTKTNLVKRLCKRTLLTAFLASSSMPVAM